MANEIAAAIALLERERQRIDAALRALQGVNGTTATTRGGSVSSGSGKTRRKLSKAARARIAAAQKARWAKQKSAAK